MAKIRTCFRFAFAKHTAGFCASVVTQVQRAEGSTQCPIWHAQLVFPCILFRVLSSRKGSDQPGGAIDNDDVQSASCTILRFCGF
jgi:hypothetical protein